MSSDLDGGVNVISGVALKSLNFRCGRLKINAFNGLEETDNVVWAISFHEIAWLLPV